MTSGSRTSIRVGPAKPRASRAWAPRSKSGCLTCRSRRVKCDEAKPSCRRCMLLGCDCEYPGQSEASTILVQTEPSNRPAPVEVTSTRKELHMFDIFRKEVVFKITGALDETFWTIDVLQATRVYPAVWHGCLALAAIQKRDQIQSTQLASEHRQNLYYFAIEQYNHAIRQMSEILQEGATSYAQKEASLLTCVLFSGISALLGDMKQAAVHIQGALELYYKWEFYRELDNPSTDNITSRRIFNAHALNLIITRGETQLLSWLSGAHTPTSSRRFRFPRCAREPFQNSREAYLELQPIATSLMKEWGSPSQRYHDGGSKEDEVVMINELMDELHFWKGKWNDLDRQSRDSGTFETGIEMVETAWIALDICLRSIHTDVGVLPDFNIQFSRIVDIYERHIHTERARRHRKKDNGTVFSFTSVMCEMLVFVGISCRNSHIRQRAIQLLKEWPQRDVLCDAGLLVALCEARVGIEEMGAQNNCAACLRVQGKEICLDHLVITSALEFVEDHKAILSVRNFQALRLGQPATDIILEW